jgi:hypothetical protein
MGPYPADPRRGVLNTCISPSTITAHRLRRHPARSDQRLGSTLFPHDPHFSHFGFLVPRVTAPATATAADAAAIYVCLLRALVRRSEIPDAGRMSADARTPFKRSPFLY